MESTATWMQDAAFPQLDLWQRVMPRWAQNTESQMSEDGPTKSYGSAVWDHWLAGRYGPGVVREVWDRSPHTDGPALDALRVYDAVISAHGGDGFHGEFTRFAAALPEWRESSSGFADPSLMPDVERVATLQVDGAAVELPLRWDRFALLDVPNVQSHAIRLEARLPAGKRGGIALVGRTGSPESGTVTTQLLELPAGGNGDVTLQLPGRFQRITAVLVGAHLGASEGGETASGRIVSIPNGAPTATFVTAPDPPSTGRATALDASASHDDDGRIVDYDWDLDGDGSFETTTGSLARLTHRFKLSGPQTVRLRVTDDEGLQTVTSRTFEVRDGTRPVVSVSVRRRQHIRSLLRGLRLLARSSEAGRLTAELRLGSRAARRIGLRARRGYAVLGRTRTTIGAARGRPVTVDLARRGRHALSRTYRAAVVLSVRVVDRAGNVGATQRRIVVSR